MATSQTRDPSTEPETDSESETPGVSAADAITAAPALALNGVLKGRTLDELGDALNGNSAAFSALWAVYPTFPELADSEAEASEQADRRAQSVLFDAAIQSDDTDTDDTDTVIRITEEYENRYGDQKVAIETPAPWEIEEQAADPDADEYDVGTEWDDNSHAVAVPPNAVIKALIWNEHHYEFHGADDAGHIDNQWTIDVSGIDRLREAATDAGYQWDDDRGTDPDHYLADDQPDGLDRLTAFAEEGDTVRVRYLKKNGNGIGTKEGEVTQAATGDEETEYGYSPTQGLVFERADGNTTKLKRDDDNDPGVFGGGYYPFMGQPVSVEVVPTDADEA
jgi:hypothetical protein